MWTHCKNHIVKTMHVPAGMLTDLLRSVYIRATVVLHLISWLYLWWFQSSEFLVFMWRSPLTSMSPFDLIVWRYSDMPIIVMELVSPFNAPPSSYSKSSFFAQLESEFWPFIGLLSVAMVTTYFYSTWHTNILVRVSSQFTVLPWSYSKKWVFAFIWPSPLTIKEECFTQNCI